MRRKAKTDYHHGSLRRALIQAAVRVIGKRGIEALNLRELAARVGVTPGAPYHHFPNRSELLRAIAEEGFEKFGALLIAERDAAPADAAARLEALGGAYVSFAVAHPGYFRVMFHGDAMASGPTGPGLSAFHLLRDAVVACQAAGAAPDGDPAPLVLTAWSAVHGLATLWVDGALPFEGMDPARLAPEIGRMVANMFAAMAREGGVAEPAPGSPHRSGPGAPESRPTPAR
ncbi:MAG: TetR/AcrR family transcriptional regulator [Hyphomicrobiales bacterium]|nr:TetR/AcrR family transcriptional regulator [Hyphomicrobiales bacterium]